MPKSKRAAASQPAALITLPFAVPARRAGLKILSYWIEPTGTHIANGPLTKPMPGSIARLSPRPDRTHSAAPGPVDLSPLGRSAGTNGQPI
jgi:hypothetical protein